MFLAKICPNELIIKVNIYRAAIKRTRIGKLRHKKKPDSHQTFLYLYHLLFEDQLRSSRIHTITL